MKFGQVAIFALTLALCGVAHAKGNFQARGVIADLKMHHSEITFKFTGKLSFGVASAPQTGGKHQKWNMLESRVAGLTVFIANWTERYESEKKAARPDVDRIFAELSKFAADGSEIEFSIDNPSFSLSNEADLVRVSGTYFYGGRIENQ